MLSRVLMLLAMVASASAFVVAPASRVARATFAWAPTAESASCHAPPLARHGSPALGGPCPAAGESFRARLTRVVCLARGIRTNNTPAKFAPSGPFGGAKAPGTEGGWVGDKSRSVQIRKFEQGADYLFFQGPAPKTAVQEDLPSFLSADNFADLEIKPLQILVTLTGFASFAAVAAVVVA